MFSEPRRTKDTPEQRLGEQLRDEALAERPAFSRELHARVMSEIALPSDSSAVAPLPPSRSIRRKVSQWAAVAAGLAAAAFGASQLLRPPSLSRKSADQVVLVPAMPSKYSFDDLNHGAGIALRLVVDQLPIEVPADDWGLPAIE